MMSLIVDSCPLTKLADGLSKLHSADDYAVAWLTNYGSPQRMHMTTTTSKLLLGCHVLASLQLVGAK